MPKVRIDFKPLKKYTHGSKVYKILKEILKYVYIHGIINENQVFQ